MSYCRWSSDDFASDVYVYESVYGGWQTHVAGRRHVFDRDALGPWPDGDLDDDAAAHAWAARYRALMDAVRNAEMVDINGPLDGQCFLDDTPGECADRLEFIRAVGYHVPQYAIDRLRSEAMT